MESWITRGPTCHPRRQRHSNAEIASIGVALRSSSKSAPAIRSRGLCGDMTIQCGLHRQGCEKSKRSAHHYFNLFGNEASCSKRLGAFSRPRPTYSSRTLSDERDYVQKYGFTGTKKLESNNQHCDEPSSRLPIVHQSVLSRSLQAPAVERPGLPLDSKRGLGPIRLSR
jgi:hypothetical protein